MLAGVESMLRLGLFAIFGIIRYRTNAIPIREMTHLFIVIALAVINHWRQLQLRGRDCGSQRANLGTVLRLGRWVCGTPRYQDGGVRPHRFAP